MSEASVIEARPGEHLPPGRVLKGFPVTLLERVA